MVQTRIRTGGGALRQIRGGSAGATGGEQGGGGRNEQNAVHVILLASNSYKRGPASAHESVAGDSVVSNGATEPIV